MLCRNGETSAGGEFSFEEIEADWHAFEVVPEPGYATLLAPVVFGDMEMRTLDLVMPRLDPAVDLPAGGPAELDVAEGLHLTIGTGQVDPPLFEDPATEVAGVLAEVDGRVPVDGASEVVAVWYLAPFNHVANQGGLPARFDNLWALPEGNAYEVWVGSYDDAEWQLAGTVTVSGGELVGDVLLPRISTVALVVP